MYDNDKIKTAVAANISILRTQRGLTQLQLAEMLSYSDKAVSKWENGTSDPSTSNLIALAKLFDVPVEELLKNIEM